MFTSDSVPGILPCMTMMISQDDYIEYPVFFEILLIHSSTSEDFGDPVLSGYRVHFILPPPVF